MDGGWNFGGGYWRVRGEHHAGLETWGRTARSPVETPTTWPIVTFSFLFHRAASRRVTGPMADARPLTPWGARRRGCPFRDTGQPSIVEISRRGHRIGGGHAADQRSRRQQEHWTAISPQWLTLSRSTGTGNGTWPDRGLIPRRCAANRRRDDRRKAVMGTQGAVAGSHACPESWKRATTVKRSLHRKAIR